MICSTCGMTNLSIDCRYCVGKYPTSIVGVDVQPATFNPFDPFQSGRDIINQPSTPTKPTFADKVESGLSKFGLSLEHAALYLMIGGVLLGGIFAYWSYKTDALSKAERMLKEGYRESSENKKIALKMLERAP